MTPTTKEVGTLEAVARAAAEAALWVAAINEKPIEDRHAAVEEWMRQADESGLFRYPKLNGQERL